MMVVIHVPKVLIYLKSHILEANMKDFTLSSVLQSLQWPECFKNWNFTAANR